MPRELITIQVGQCGNQIGYRFWDLAFREHCANSKTKIYDDALSSFFRNTDSKSNLKVGSKITDLKARTIIVDMEEGVINQMLKSELGQLFDERQFIHDVSGAGNNWAHGYYEYGNKYKTMLVDKIGKAVEQCESLQSFFLMHSLGGGTGSGVGTFILSLLEEYYSDVFRFTASVFPSQQDDVITSPYNSILSLYELMQHADCVLPIDNQALINIVNEADALKAKLGSTGNTKSEQPTMAKKQKAYDKMNNIIAHLLSNLTCSMRFEGILNVDFNEITMNLVPYPDLHFLISSIAPLYSIIEPKLQPRRPDEIFNDIYSPDHQLIQCNPKASTYLAMGLILRGNISFSDVNRNIKMLRDKKDLNFVYWNSEGFKYGICNTAPIGQPYSALCLSNNTCISKNFEEMRDRFNKLYKKGLYVHHYEKYMPKSHFDEAIQAVDDIILKYKSLDKLEPMKEVKRLKPLLL